MIFRKGERNLDTILIEWFQQHPSLAIGISLLANVVISVFAVIPSFFLTTANIAFFGFEQGLFISFAGEVLGAIVSFYLYKKGILLLKERGKTKYVKWFKRFEQLKGIKAFGLVLALRLLPFMPSGLVTLLAATSSMGALSFIAASAIGKIPAVALEAFGANQLLLLNENMIWFVSAIALILIFVSLRVSSRPQ
ncbi:VTT domain-containing protein [Jeotgalibacillus sp. ET6]|uniref:TVP38/TMEM64 family protein n=1 Tax=Jeotgalibacillus sp. ET6 TaxID=3037260 RepID=UPI0024188125|nr:VTT domain-containing protein [Jeotgalibacillus sp. ET6]MDG5472326.1 VTT domain-containing protein [Jeotgalibacillus sp. ET6]